MKATTKGFSSRPVRLRVLQVQCVFCYRCPCHLSCHGISRRIEGGFSCQDAIVLGAATEEIPCTWSTVLIRTEQEWYRFCDQNALNIQPDFFVKIFPVFRFPYEPG